MLTLVSRVVPELGFRFPYVVSYVDMFRNVGNDVGT